MKITELQQNITTNIERQIKNCLKSNSKSHVVEICLPTGWGKTRAVCQALLKWSNKIRNMRLTLIIFPRSGVLLKPWRNCVAWCGRKQKTIQGCRLLSRNFKPVQPMARLERKRVSPRELGLVCVKDSDSNDNSPETIPIRALLGNRTGWNFLLSKCQNDPRGPLGKKGPVVIVLDEFHRKPLFSLYQEHVANSGKYENLYDYFMDHLGLSESKRKVIFLLISATPINPVNEREMYVPSDDEGTNDGGAGYENELKEEIVHWRTVVASLNGHKEAKDIDDPFVVMLRKGKISRSISSIWKSGQRKLMAELSKRTSDVRKAQKVSAGAQWLNDYHSFARVAYYPPSDMPLYVVENLWLGGVRNLNHISRGNYGYATRKIIIRLYEEKQTRKIKSLKLRTLIQFLKLPQNADRKFLIFCVYQGTASLLKDELKKRHINADWAKGNNPNKLIEAFNDRDNLLRLLIATDSLAEGFDLHKAKQHLIHYELAWSPLRMIQRFGRTWRIMESTGNLTKPVAYHIPHTYSSDEEVLNRLQRRWKILKEKTKLNFPSMEIVLGHRLSPFPE
jgi:superfamily II DNA or RNA helicase